MTSEHTDKEQQVEQLKQQIEKLKRDVNALCIGLFFLILVVGVWLFRVETTSKEATRRVASDVSLVQKSLRQHKGGKDCGSYEEVNQNCHHRD